MVKAKIVHERWYNPVAGIGFPLIILVIGVVWLGNDLHWWDTKISVWPILLIVLSAYWILKALMWKRHGAY